MQTENPPNDVGKIVSMKESVILHGPLGTVGPCEIGIVFSVFLDPTGAESALVYFPLRHGLASIPTSSIEWLEKRGEPVHSSALSYREPTQRLHRRDVGRRVILTDDAGLPLEPTPDGVLRATGEPATVISVNARKSTAQVVLVNSGDVRVVGPGDFRWGRDWLDEFGDEIKFDPNSGDVIEDGVDRHGQRRADIHSAARLATRSLEDATAFHDALANLFGELKARAHGISGQRLSQGDVGRHVTDGTIHGVISAVSNFGQPLVRHTRDGRSVDTPIPVANLMWIGLGERDPISWTPENVGHLVGALAGFSDMLQLLYACMLRTADHVTETKLANERAVSIISQIVNGMDEFTKAGATGMNDGFESTVAEMMKGGKGK